VVVFIDGAFGIGKSTVAGALRRLLPGSAIFDPEWVGFVLRRLPRAIPLAGRGTDDFQDLALWRRGSVLGIRAMRAARDPVIVPMAFSNRAYLEEILGGVGRFDPAVRHFCLVAPLAVVLERLAARASAEARPVTAWEARRAEECCAAHRAPGFGEPVAAEARAPDAIAAEIARRLEAGARPVR
jgi:hypothetical protein